MDLAKQKSVEKIQKFWKFYLFLVKNELESHIEQQKSRVQSVGWICITKIL